MSIHAHKKARKQAELDRMIKDITPLNDQVFMGHYDNLDNVDKKEFAEQNYQISKMSRKINRLWNFYTTQKTVGFI